MIEQEEEKSGDLKELSQAFYAALGDNSVDRKWKKKAVNFLVEISELQTEIETENNDFQPDVEKMIRRGEDLLNQLNRY